MTEQEALEEYKAARNAWEKSERALAAAHDAVEAADEENDKRRATVGEKIAQLDKAIAVVDR